MSSSRNRSCSSTQTTKQQRNSPEQSLCLFSLSSKLSSPLTTRRRRSLCFRYEPVLHVYTNTLTSGCECFPHQLLSVLPSPFFLLIPSSLYLSLLLLSLLFDSYLLILFPLPFLLHLSLLLPPPSLGVFYIWRTVSPSSRDLTAHE